MFKPEDSQQAPELAAAIAEAKTEPAAVTSAAARVERDLEEVRDDRDEERFLWILCFIILFDCVVLGRMDNFAAPLVIGVLQLLLLIGLARKFGVDDITVLVTRLLHRLSDRADK